MEKKLIFKVEFDKQTKDAIKINTEIDNFRVDFKEPFAEVMDWAIRTAGYDYKSNNLMEDITSLEQLHELIVKNGFKLTLNEVENSYRLIIYKNACSTSFEITKDKPIETLLINANDWVKEMLYELNHTVSATISGKGINSLLETIDLVYGLLD